MRDALRHLNLRVMRAPSAGFCYGVQRAFAMANQAAKDPSLPSPKRTLGPLIHNAAVVDLLRAQGLEPLPDSTVDESGLGACANKPTWACVGTISGGSRPAAPLDVAAAPLDVAVAPLDAAVGSAEAECPHRLLAGLSSGTIVVRSHGVSRQLIDEALRRGLSVVDATCPHVARVHQAAADMVAAGCNLVIVGDTGHPEVAGILGTVGGAGAVISSAAEAAALPPGRYGVVVQTTQSLETLRSVVSALLGHSSELRVANTICTATRERQDGVRNIAPEVDVIVVVGDPRSANTNRLVELARDCGVPTHLVERAGDLSPEWFVPGSRVGVTAGASTPSHIIEEVISAMHDDVDEKPEVNIQSMADAVEFTNALRPMRMGDIYDAVVVSVTAEEVLVDIGYKSEGTIQLKELALGSATSAIGLVKPGDVIRARVVYISGKDDSVVLSKRLADQDASWEALKEAFESHRRVSGTITGTIKGGLVVDVGVRGFLPASQVDKSFVSDLEAYVGRASEFYITELEERRKNVVVNRRKVVEEDAVKARAEAFAALKPGAIVEGTVKRLTDFGAFIDIGGGTEGLLHLSEMSWGRTKQASDVVHEGDTLRVMVLGADEARGRISLGLKQVLEDPWVKVPQNYAVGTTVTGTVVSLPAFGAFVRLEDGVEGLVHISQLSRERISSPSQAVQIGQEVTAKVVTLDEAHKRIGLSMRELLPEEGAPTPAEVADLAEYRSQEPSGGATIGELLGRALGAAGAPAAAATASEVKPDSGGE